MDGPKWCTIESDPGVFTELIEKFGVKNVQVEELWDFEDKTFERLGEIYGFVFLFKWDKKIETEINKDVLDEPPEGLYFAKQTIQNACGTQAIVNILLNNNERLELGNTLSNFREFTISFNPDLRGEELNNSTAIRDAHNSFRRPEPIQLEISKDDDTEKEDAFHFISYINQNGILYELDGLQTGPRLIGGIQDENSWYKEARDCIQDRMKLYESKELRFTLLAICKNLRVTYQEEIDTLKDNTDETSKLRVSQLQGLIKDENNKFEKWKNENIRRRHNYFPFIFNLLTELAKKNKLSPMIERATKKKEDKLKKLKEKKEKEKEQDKEKNTETTKDTKTDTKDDKDVQMSDKN